LETRKKITEVTARRYRASGKKGKTKTLDEFCQTTGYNRAYASHLLSNWGKTRLVTLDGGTAALKAAKPKGKRRAGGGRPRAYTDEVIACLRKVRAFYDFQCGTLPAPLMRLQMPVLEGSETFGITQETAAKLI
jgi:hypothetical protein